MDYYYYCSIFLPEYVVVVVAHCDISLLLFHHLSWRRYQLNKGFPSERNEEREEGKEGVYRKSMEGKDFTVSFIIVVLQS